MDSSKRRRASALASLLRIFRTNETYAIRWPAGPQGSVLWVGAVAQLGEHRLCKPGVTGSIPVSSTIPGPSRSGRSDQGGRVRRSRNQVMLASREVGSERAGPRVSNAHRLRRFDL